MDFTLTRLFLMNFKNYDEANWEFSPSINAIVGENGTGKTNLLDAVHYLCMTRSAISSVEQQNVRHGAGFFMVSGKFERDEEGHTVQAGYDKDKKQKSILFNRKEYPKLSEHIGKFPCVFIGPNDTDLVREGSEERRKFLDSTLSQVDRDYLQQLQTYQQALRQRNALLKYFDEVKKVDLLLLEPYDQRLLETGKRIFETRKAFTESFTRLVYRYYEALAPEKEKVSLRYKSQCWERDFEGRFAEARTKDLTLQRTTLGVHRDDLEFELSGFSIKKYGSQGQQKSFVIALKLAQFTYFYETTQRKPLLLLDDIFDKLDDSRIGYLISLLEAHVFGQVFLTDARPERSKQQLQGLKNEIRFFETGQGVR